ncbi:MAG: hypothetical protein K0U86_06585 [Planctomycetes bacterium]|nr:hypothetical protein [Planctomycetota bacterium]MCH9724554.1 hypothetical protein [Planctomycetota bacterium]MCH9779408.1 hypothetical protein [Planctomycetota bacterium]MCH9791588.1 hypothetical protein [Planctomycetota bacterium]
MKKYTLLILVFCVLAMVTFGKWMDLNPKILLSFITILGVVFIFDVVIPRIRMLRRAKAIESEISDPERMIVYHQFSSIWPKRKHSEIDAKKTEMARDDWVFLKASEARLSKTLRSMGGGLNLHFIRDKSFKKSERETAVYL